MDVRNESGALQQAMGVLRNILTCPEMVTSLSSSLQQQRTGSPFPNVNHSAVENEMKELFRPNSSASQLSRTGTRGQTEGLQHSLRYQTQKHFGNWNSRPRKRIKKHYHDTFNKDVILLPKPTSCVVIKHRSKQQLHEQGHILHGFEFQKSWDQRTVTEQIREAFGEKLSADVGLEYLMACGNRLISPKLRAGQDLDANLIHKIYKSKALYIRPSKPILEHISGYSSDDNSCEETAGSTRWLRSSSQDRPSDAPSDGSTSAVGACLPNYSPAVEPSASFTQTPAMACGSSLSHSRSSTSTSVSFDNLPEYSLESCPSISQHCTSSFEGTSSIDPSVSCSPYQSNSSAHHLASATQQSSNYDSYLSVMGALSDVSSGDEVELNKAILASLNTESCPTECPVPVKEILQELAGQINHLKQCKFNINRTSILDGAIRGFKRGTYDPCHSMCVRFSDDMGVPEEGVDLGGPRREFLRLLIGALFQSPMFEGQEGNLNLALDSSAMREDRYFIAGRAIAVSLVHGGPPADSLSPTLFSCLVDGPESAKPVLEDVADTDLREKIKKVAECQSLEELLAATQPLEEYLANSGCLRPLLTLEHKDLLVDDILMFQVVHRVRGPFERFLDGLRTLGVLAKIQAHPESFRPLLCWSPSNLSADLVDSLFTIRLSPAGSNKRRAEEMVIPFWRDYLSDAEDLNGTEKLGTILAFATGASTVPAIGFSPQPSIEFLHQELESGASSKLPIANTCINCLKLPLHTSYREFQENMDFALNNTQGFGIA